MPLSIQSYAIFFSILVATLGMIFCSSPSRNLSFTSSNEAIEECRSFLEELKEKDKPKINTFISDMKHWRLLGDSAICCIKKDTIQKPHYFPLNTFSHLDDSIRMELTRLVLSKERSFADMFQLKMELSAYANDSSLVAARTEAEPFFDTVWKQTGIKDADNFIAEYQRFLQNVQKKGIHKKTELLEYIKEGNRYFKTFLMNMHKLRSQSMSEIT